MQLPGFAMNPMKTHLLLLLLLHTHLAISSRFSNSGLDLLGNDEIDALMGRVCAGKTGGCGDGATVGQVEEEEFQIDSEVSRRLLIMQKRYISYETLKRDAVPCSTPGASYYNCGPAKAHRYSRGCEAINRCARSIRQ